MDKSVIDPPLQIRKLYLDQNMALFTVIGHVSVILHPSFPSMGSTESLAGTLDEDDEERKEIRVESKVFKSAFAKQLEERRAPLMREVSKEGERAREAAWRVRESERRLVVEENRLAEREYCR